MSVLLVVSLVLLFKPAAIRDRKNSASVLWDELKPLQEDAVAIARAARLPFFQATTNRGAEAVYPSDLRELSAVEQVHFLFQLRACALLALDRHNDAGQDVLTSLRLAQLARQSPDAKSSFRVRVMLARSLQPIWEGMVEHRWSESQLSAFQNELARFNLLSDHTNAIRRVTLAYIETWRALPDAKTPMRSAQPGGGVYGRPSDRAWQPRVCSSPSPPKGRTSACWLAEQQAKGCQLKAQSIRVVVSSRFKYSSRGISTAPSRRVAGVIIWMSNSVKPRARK